MGSCLDLAPSWGCHEAELTVSAAMIETLEFWSRSAMLHVKQVSRRVIRAAASEDAAEEGVAMVNSFSEASFDQIGDVRLATESP